MLSIAKLRVDGEAYYLDLVLRGADEYYTEGGEAPGRWVGAASAVLGVSGTVSGEELRTVLAGQDPVTGSPLAASPRRVPGFDLTFSAPKSVSLLFALTDREAGRRVVAAHDAAVHAALAYLEREASVVRRGHAGATQIDAQGFVGAAFRHRTSRAGDPQLHTHVLVANLGRGTDGRWSALDARLLYRELRTAGYLYQAQLRYELTRGLGVAWGPVARGSSEVAGFPRTVLRAFSQRRLEIEAALSAHGATTRHAAHIAALATRAPKRSEGAVRLQPTWRQRASALGFTPADASRLLWRAASLQPTIDTSRLVDALTLETASFGRRDVLRAVADHAAQGARIPDLEQLAHRLLAGPNVIQLGDDLFTTSEMLRVEAAILANATQRVSAGVGLVPPVVTKSVLRTRPQLSEEQRRMVAELTTSGRGVDVVLGVAGAGKTDALGAAHAAWQATGHRVIGVALAARAATELQHRTGMVARTLDSLLLHLDHPGEKIPTGAVVVLDEAAMVGTRKLARLLAHAAERDAKVVLVGDPRQLPEIEAGGAYAALSRHLPTITLIENRRQHDPVERKALAELRRGDVRGAVDRLHREGRITTATSVRDARERIVTDWMAARGRGHDAVMLAVHRRDVELLNQAARSRLVAAGQLRPGGLRVGRRTFSAGDRVMTLSNRRRLGVVNGDRGTITATTRQAVTVALDRGSTVVLPSPYLSAGHLTHGYAMTVHKAQGMTCDEAFVLASPALSREAGYTALSRGRRENRLYLPRADPSDIDVGHGVRAAPANPTEQLIAALEVSRRKQLALEHPGLRRSLPASAPALELGISLGR